MTVAPGIVTHGGALAVDVSTGQLAVTGFSYNLICPAWYHNLRPLVLGGPDVRGGDRVLSGASGAKKEKRRVTVTEYALEVVISGYVTPAGVANANPDSGLAANIATLISGVYSPSSSSDSTRYSTLTPPGLSARHAYVHYLKLEPGSQAGAILLATGHISIADGWFT